MKYIKEFEDYSSPPPGGWTTIKSHTKFAIGDFVKHRVSKETDSNIYKVKEIGKGDKVQKYFIEIYKNGGGKGVWRNENSLELADKSPDFLYKAGDYVFVDNYDWVNKYHRIPYCKIKFLNSKGGVRSWDYMVKTIEMKQVMFGNITPNSREKEVDAYLDQVDIKRKMTQDEIDTFDSMCMATKYNL